MSTPSVEQLYVAQTKAIDATGQYTEVEIPYVVFDAADEDAALMEVFAIAPKDYEGVPLDRIRIESRDNETTYKVNANYRGSSDSSSNDDADDDTSTVSFDCGGGSKHITYSIEQRTVYGTKDAGGTIGWNGSTGTDMSIAGVEVPTAQFRETYTRIMKLSAITTPYKRIVGSLVGKVNSTAFKGWQAGEVMFIGMSYSTPAKNSTKVTVTYNFVIQFNEPNAIINGKSVGPKLGWEYIWALNAAKVENDIPKVKVEAVYIAKVCEYANFNALGL